MNFIKIRFIFYIISLFFIFSGAVLIITSGIRFSTEFKGGTNISFTSETTSVKDIDKLAKDTIESTAVVSKISNSYTLHFDSSLSEEKLAKIKEELTKKPISGNISEVLVVSPTVGGELITKTALAIFISVIVIFIFVAYSFKNSVSAFSAILAMLHDTFILIGFFALFGKLFGVQVDLLIITALLTVLSFSLYDTIVIFDKVRENIKKESLLDYKNILDKSVKQTMVRSINNSLTSILALFALSLFVSGSIYWFLIALLIGVVFGTYSSPFVAVPLFYDLNRLIKKYKKSN